MESHRLSQGRQVRRLLAQGLPEGRHDHLEARRRQQFARRDDADGRGALHVPGALRARRGPAGKADLEVVAAPSIVIRYLSMNTQQKPFDNPKVRQAIAYAINKEALAKVAFNGYATPAEGVVPAGVEYSVKLGAWPYDVAKAKKLMAEAGYPDGFETELWSAYNHSTAQKVTQFLQQQLAADRHQDQDHAARSRPARREGRELAGSSDRAGAPVLRRLVVVDRRSRLGDCVRCSRRTPARRACSTRRTTRVIAVDGDIKGALATTDKVKKAKSLQGRAGNDLDGRAVGATGRRKAAVCTQQEAVGRLRNARRVVQFHRSRPEALRFLAKAAPARCLRDWPSCDASRQRMPARLSM